MLVDDLLKAMHQDWCESADSYGTYGQNFQRLFNQIKPTLSTTELEEIKKELKCRLRNLKLHNK
jgi:hypothetical protein